jgi:hypothetical protein
VEIIHAVVRLLATIVRADGTSNPTLPSANEIVQTQIAREHPDVTTFLNTSIGKRPFDKKFDNPKVVATLP